MKLPSAYEPAKYESDIYSLWEQGKIFTANPHSPKEHFSISMPPPNETGTLHMGSALFVVLQDILARRARQEGKDVLWLPGTDHAALATDNLVEKHLAEQGTSKHEIGREAFIKEVKQFVGNNRDRILSQLKAMGASCDWSRTRYTLDGMLNRTVNEVFVKMYTDGLIYKGNRIVNWDPKLETTVSDDEVVYKEEKTSFYTLKYGPFTIGTARPETKFGDKYVVMHPDDKRYQQYKHGQTFEAEWINGPVKATIIKDEAIDPKFGTGVMTITPWHDHTDFDIAERHGLEKEQIIDFEGKLLSIAGEFKGMDIDKARPKIIDKLKAKNLLVKEEDYAHTVPVNSRGGAVIEPQIMLQWFVDVNRPAVQWKGQLRSLREVMRAVIDDGDVKIIPRRFEKVYFHWIDNLRDWNISRQIWWGHQIPIWYKGDEIYTGVTAPKGQGWEQDPDTLDTWFSSALWTWSTLINPDLADDFSLSLEDLLDRSLDYKTYHPTSVMETGWDILFFWVARMILATTYATGQIPFKTVYLHGLVRAETGKKMSKSDPDTIIDPLEVIPEYGTDALRLALVSGVSAGQDMRLGKSKIVDNRNFANKLWNIARYIEDAGEAGAKAEPESIADHWILNKLSILTDELEKDLANFRFGEAYQNLYHFVWDDFADWYIEASKTGPNPAMLHGVLEATLVLAHPFAPFITEAIWRELEFKKGGLLASELLPKLVDFDKTKAEEFSEIMKIVKQSRRVSAVLQLSKLDLHYHDEPLVENNSELIKHLGRLGGVHESVSGLRLVLTGYNVLLDVSDEQAKAYKDNLEKEAQVRMDSVIMLLKRLQNKAYMANAPEELKAETKERLERERKLADQLREEWSDL
jgi:valyl-tRNA synthetase